MSRSPSPTKQRVPAEPAARDTDTDLKALAGDYAARALATLADIMTNGESEATRVAAARALLDRGFAKADPGGELDLAGTMDRVIAEMREREERLRAAAR